ncbi:MAG: hypothetical protein J6K28_00510 [Alistipes sp.]|nr:hypothetical protein [Alistipes sp.]
MPDLQRQGMLSGRNVFTARALSRCRAGASKVPIDVQNRFGSAVESDSADGAFRVSMPYALRPEIAEMRMADRYVRSRKSPKGWLNRFALGKELPKGCLTDVW